VPLRVSALDRHARAACPRSLGERTSRSFKTYALRLILLDSRVRGNDESGINIVSCKRTLIGLEIILCQPQTSSSTEDAFLLSH
jgi:hypothetical protein